MIALRASNRSTRPRPNRKPVNCHLCSCSHAASGAPFAGLRFCERCRVIITEETSPAPNREARAARGAAAGARGSVHSWVLTRARGGDSDAKRLLRRTLISTRFDAVFVDESGAPIARADVCAAACGTEADAQTIRDRRHYWEQKKREWDSWTAGAYAGRVGAVRTLTVDAEVAAHLLRFGFTTWPTIDEFKAAFRERVFAQHPDRGGDSEELRATLEAAEKIRALAGWV